MISVIDIWAVLKYNTCVDVRYNEVRIYSINKLSFIMKQQLLMGETETETETEITTHQSSEEECRRGGVVSVRLYPTRP